MKQKFALAFFLAFSFWGAREVPAQVSIKPGDILIADFNADAVIHVHPVTGAQTVVSSGWLLVDPVGIAIALNGTIFVADANAFGGPGGIIWVNPLTGAQTTVSSGGFFVTPRGIAIAPNGDIFVADGSAFGGPCPGGCGGVIRVNPLTGVQTVVSSGGFFEDPLGIAVDANGDVLVADPSAFGGSGGIIRVNPATGAQTAVSSGGDFVNPSGLALAPNGDIFVADSGAFGGPGGVIRVNPSTGAQAMVSSGGSFVDPVGIAMAPSGDLVIADPSAFGGPGGVIRVDPQTGAQTTVSSEGSFSAPAGIAIADPGPIASNVVAAPNPVAVGQGVLLTANVNDSTTGGSNIASAEYNLDSGSFNPMSASDGAFDGVSEDVSAQVPPFASPGLHTVCVRGADARGNLGAVACVLLAVYDPQAGFVSGGGTVVVRWDYSNPPADGPAVFGFIVRYLPGQSTPSGNFQFQFRAGDLRFTSTSMNWLVVTDQPVDPVTIEPRAIFRGEGMLDGSTVCKFEVDVRDGSTFDTFGLKIFSCDGAGDRFKLAPTTLYTGNIIIHK